MYSGLTEQSCSTIDVQLSTLSCANALTFRYQTGAWLADKADRDLKHCGDSIWALMRWRFRIQWPQAKILNSLCAVTNSYRTPSLSNIYPELLTNRLLWRTPDWDPFLQPCDVIVWNLEPRLLCIQMDLGPVSQEQCTAVISPIEIYNMKYYLCTAKGFLENECLETF